jgi:hypothetical protein
MTASASVGLRSARIRLVGPFAVRTCARVGTRSRAAPRAAGREIRAPRWPTIMRRRALVATAPAGTPREHDPGKQRESAGMNRDGDRVRTRASFAPRPQSSRPSHATDCRTESSPRSLVRPPSGGCRTNPAGGGVCAVRGADDDVVTSSIRGGHPVSQNFLSCDRDQELLLPPSLREWLPEGPLAWFVLDAVEQMDLTAFLRGLPRRRLGSCGT